MEQEAVLRHLYHLAGGELGAGLLHHRLVQVRVERGARRALDAIDPVPLERVEELRRGGRHTGRQRPGVARPLCGVQRAIQVVERREQVAGQRLDRVPPLQICITQQPLAGVVEVGELQLVVVQLRLGRVQLRADRVQLARGVGGIGGCFVRHQLKPWRNQTRG